MAEEDTCGVLFRLIATTFTLMSLNSSAHASLGDNTAVYRECLKLCLEKNCSSESSLRKFREMQPLSEKFLAWSCENECSYQCMWKTVDIFIQYQAKVPQFYGKWPFVRIMGVQEPASVLFSILNGITNAVGVWILVSKVRPSNPLYKPALAFGIFGINMWVWSTVFHIRDFPLTEKLDYFSATTGVLYSFYFGIHRMSLGLDKKPDPNRGQGIRATAFTLMLLFLIFHISYLSFVKFDYGYNMLANVVIGISNGITWVFYHWKTRQIFHHQWKATYAVCFSTALLSLELLDFPPVWWAVDAHAMWHAGTIAVPALWYPFLVDECSIIEPGFKFD